MVTIETASIGKENRSGRIGKAEWGLTKRRVSDWETEDATPVLDMFQGIKNILVPHSIICLAAKFMPVLMEKEIFYLVLPIDGLKARRQQTE